MKKVLSSILISFIIFVNLLAPISVGWGRDGVEVKKNEAMAVDCVINNTSWSPILDNKTKNPGSAILLVDTSNCTGRYLSGEIKLDNSVVSNFNEILITNDVFSINFTLGEKNCKNNICNLTYSLNMSKPVIGVISAIGDMFAIDTKLKDQSFSYKCAGEKCSETEWSYSLLDGVSPGSEKFDFEQPSIIIDSLDNSITTKIVFPKNTRIEYGTAINNGHLKVQVIVKKEGEEAIIKEANLKTGTNTEDFIFPNLIKGDTYTVTANLVEVTTYNQDKNYLEIVKDQSVVVGGTSQITVAAKSDMKRIGDNSIMPACNMTGGIVGQGTFSGCLAQGFYYVLFVPTSYLFALSGVFFDNTFSYSVQDTSYRSAFVVQGWGLVRDFCNLFFIFILLYVAISTILDIHGFNTKQTIINVVVIGLFINFSLFATQLIIDASNITARVFYNSDAIKITEKGVDGATTLVSKVGPDGVIPLSAGLVNKVNPQNLILHAKQINKVPVNTGDRAVTDTDSADNMNAGTFILIVIIASAVNIVGFIVFLSVGLIFITRVIGLWISMILAPLAFFTYIIPSFSKTKTIGWEHWWPETLKMAFLAPAFMFFMYIILKFLELDLISDPMNKDGLTFFIATLIPFAFIMILMMKAKKLATDMSGEMGQQITSKLAMAGGLALGAATGGAALLGRGTIGRLANKANNSNWLNDAAAGKKGKMLQFIGKAGKSTANYTAKSSFDVRQTKAGSALSKETGLNLDIGTNYLGLDSKKTAGGYVAQQQRKIEKENKFKDNLGFDHHQYEHVGDKISEQEAALAKYKADVTVNHKSKEYQARVAKEEYDIAGLKKEQERIKTGRAMEYALTSKRKSGKIYDVDMTEKYVEKKRKEYENEKDAVKKEKKRKEYEHTKHALEHKDDYRDANGNIKKFGHANADGARASKQIIKEFAKGVAQGAVTGGIAGSIVPGIGTGVGLVGGGLAGGIRGLMHYSGTTNRKVGEEHNTTEKFTSNYKAPSGGGGDSHATTDTHKEEPHSEGGDDHAHAH